MSFYIQQQLLLHAAISTSAWGHTRMINATTMTIALHPSLSKLRNPPLRQPRAKREDGTSPLETAILSAATVTTILRKWPPLIAYLIAAMHWTTCVITRTFVLRPLHRTPPLSKLPSDLLLPFLRRRLAHPHTTMIEGTKTVLCEQKKK